MGVSRGMIDDLHEERAKYASIFNYPTLTWSDIGAIGYWSIVQPLSIRYHFRGHHMDLMRVRW